MSGADASSASVSNAAMSNAPISNIPMSNAPLPKARIALCAALALCAFAGNSLLCRLALRETGADPASLAPAGIDPATFTGLRLASGALVLWLLAAGAARARAAADARAGGPAPSHARAKAATDWAAAWALFVYAAGFSYAYTRLSAASGALLLFGAVQATMLGWGLLRGERLQALQWGGLLLALAGLVWLLLPGATAPAPSAALLMLGAGMAWGVYSLRGRGARDVVAQTAGNFLRSLPLAALLGIGAALAGSLRIDATGALLAVISGAVTSGLGYALWYTALPGLRASSAASLQLAVPALTAFAAVLWLDETLTARLLLASAAILGGIALTILGRRAR